jgi:hypothetical protein
VEIANDRDNSEISRESGDQETGQEDVRIEAQRMHSDGHHKLTCHRCNEEGTTQEAGRRGYRERMWESDQGIDK